MAEMRDLVESVKNFMGRINPTKLCAADDQQYVAAFGALDMLDHMADRVEKLEAVVEAARAAMDAGSTLTWMALREALAALGDGDG